MITHCKQTGKSLYLCFVAQQHNFFFIFCFFAHSIVIMENTNLVYCVSFVIYHINVTHMPELHKVNHSFFFVPPWFID